MGGPDTFLIQLRGQGEYFATHGIDGHVLITSTEPISDVRNVQIELKGFGNIFPDRKKIGEATKYHYYEEYIKYKYIIHEGELSAGNSAFPFSFVLPANIPSSFEGEHGYVRYLLEAKIDRSGIFSSNKLQSLPVRVNSIVDLNTVPGANIPQTKSKSKKFGCLCWSGCCGGPVSATVRIPHYGYVVGGVIPISAEIENLSTNTMSCTKARLHQKVVYKAGPASRSIITASRSTTTKISEVGQGRIAAGASDSWNAVPLPIPQVVPSNLGGCNINVIHVTYTLEFRVVTSCIGRDLKLKLPIWIGTIPLAPDNP